MRSEAAPKVISSSIIVRLELDRIAASLVTFPDGLVMEFPARFDGLALDETSRLE